MYGRQNAAGRGLHGHPSGECGGLAGETAPDPEGTPVAALIGALRLDRSRAPGAPPPPAGAPKGPRKPGGPRVAAVIGALRLDRSRAQGAPRQPAVSRKAPLNAWIRGGP